MAPKVTNKDLLAGAVPAPEAFDRGKGAVHSLPIESTAGGSGEFEIVYVKGASCRIGETTFQKGKPVRTRDRIVVDRCRKTAGFVVRAL